MIPFGFMVNAFGGPRRDPMYVSGLRIEIFLESIIEKFKKRKGVKFKEYKFPVVVSEITKHEEKTPNQHAPTLPRIVSAT
ncbi:CLUMA_CG020933, isoform A [Clunio marinus]|uniref:CLUMA_CG020933, isoform A n=1 Tax=Clunio marinus TaxID=568069 RepID=A0A1J1J703_9DIPT|nr:CLUMA_CG020933, isoform A [Clunio marinus]